MARIVEASSPSERDPRRLLRDRLRRLLLVIKKVYRKKVRIDHPSSLGFGRQLIDNEARNISFLYIS
ncbi:hypothetical protein A3D11_04080 [Candidatus Peribacteria bacterium RIFCSPHIGHO2_02_FULL_49_16]|nr:MAG: hypothetical protein A2880_00170 [Candidatus Peribacteria bacterium RIFCSPHIGHO2_01_FULL_49_38]OGJ59177.1 MAG: hypothetical protein A3D11_04080 [Candidatus Peribacteria bacterium RIFCSPHIGHO2_02_FULL_49_16]